VPCDRGPLGCRVLRAGKDYLTDKPPFTSLDQLAEARKAVAETSRRYMVFYGDRLGVECAVHATRLIEQGALGRVLQVIGLGPHRSKLHTRPAWFFERARYGGILCDLGSHQCEKFLHFSGSTDAEVLSSAVANFDHPQYPELEDYGEATLLGSSGVTGHHRVDWFTPAGQSSWGDGRTFVLGTRATIELAQLLRRRPVTAGRAALPGRPRGRTSHLLRGPGGTAVLRAVRPRLPAPDRDGDDPGPCLQGGRTLPAHPGLRAPARASLNRVPGVACVGCRHLPERDDPGGRA
jgi:predicted dehydrogenase